MDKKSQELRDVKRAQEEYREALELALHDGTIDQFLDEGDFEGGRHNYGMERAQDSSRNSAIQANRGQRASERKDLIPGVSSMVSATETYAQQQPEFGQSIDSQSLSGTESNQNPLVSRFRRPGKRHDQRRRQNQQRQQQQQEEEEEEEDTAQDDPQHRMMQQRAAQIAINESNTDRRNLENAPSVARDLTFGATKASHVTVGSIPLQSAVHSHDQEVEGGHAMAGPGAFTAVGATVYGRRNEAFLLSPMPQQRSQMIDMPIERAELREQELANTEHELRTRSNSTPRLPPPAPPADEEEDYDEKEEQIVDADVVLRSQYDEERMNREVSNTIRTEESSTKDEMKSSNLMCLILLAFAASLVIIAILREGRESESDASEKVQNDEDQLTSAVGVQLSRDFLACVEPLLDLEPITEELVQSNVSWKVSQVIFEADNGTSNNTCTPENLALWWMSMDQLGLPLPRPKHIIRARYLMVLLFLELDGLSWRRNRNWLSRQSLCLWDGLLCIDDFANSEVAELRLVNNTLNGTIPSKIGLVPSLTRLELPGNSISGTIPMEIAKLTGLEVLDLSYNSMSGSIPTELGLCTFLKRLNLAGNDFSGSVPSEVSNLALLDEVFV